MGKAISTTIIFIIIVIIGAIAISSSYFKTEVEQPEIKAPTEILTENKLGQVQGLGNLCNSKDECSIYCENNLEKCIDFCVSNPSNSLCGLLSKAPGTYGEQRTESKQQARFLSCGTKKEFFTVPHISVSDLQNIVPLGNLNPKGGHVFPTNHLYFHLKGFQGISTSSAKVKAPGDMWITRIGSSEYVMNGVQIKDYKMDFTVCDDIRGYFIHMTSLSQNLLDQFVGAVCKEYDTGGIHYKNCEKDFYSGISVKAGEDIGTVGGSSDFGLADLRTQQLSYANPSRWYDDPLHRVCPLDYFVPDIKSQLYALLGDSSNKRTAQPICGEVDQDELGTAQGVWFVKGTANTYPEDPHASLAHDNIDPSLGAFSIGTSLNKLGINTDVYLFDPKTSGSVNLDFKLVTPDNKVYCYETRQRFGGNSDFTILISMPDSKILQIGKGDSPSCGSGLWAFGSGFINFER